MSTLARSQIFSSIPKQGPALSAAIMDSIELFQKRSGANSLPSESFQFSAPTSPSWEGGVGGVRMPSGTNSWSTWARSLDGPGSSSDRTANQSNQLRLKIIDIMDIICHNCHNWYNISINDIIENNWDNGDNMWNNTLFYNSNWAKNSVDIIENNWNNSDIIDISDIIRLLFQLYHLCHYYFYSVVVPGHNYSQNRLCHQLYGLWQFISAKNGDTSYFWLCHAQFCWDNAYNSMA